MEGNLTYTFPSGFSAINVTEKTGTVTTRSGDVTFTYSIQNGVVTIIWPTDKTTQQWKELVESQYVNLVVEIDGVFENNVQEIKFSDTASGTVKVDSTHGVKVDKKGSYNTYTNKIDYTVTVTSTGHNTNINLSDYVEGSAITYTKGSAKSNKGTVTESGSGFKYHIDSMNNNETITINYSADVNLDALIKNGEGTGTYGTFDQTKNTVEVTSNNNPKDSDIVSGKDFDNKIKYSSIQKWANGEPKVTDDGSKKTLSWTIRANPDANVSMAGKKITDTITTPDALKYSGTGIKIVVKDKSGAVVRTDDIQWNTNRLVKNDSTWTYTVPEEDVNYSYEITYDTDIQPNSTSNNVELKNDVKDDFGDEAHGQKWVNPNPNTGGDTSGTTKKEGIKVDIKNKEITWKITIDVPKEGYNQKFEVWDLYPNCYTNNQYYYDTLKEITSIQGLQNQENYTLDTSSSEKLGIIFYRDSNKTQPGLGTTDSDRTIEIILVTKMSEGFIQMANVSVQYPNNKIQVNKNDKTVEAQGNIQVDFSKTPSLTKSHEGQSTNKVNGKDLPTYKYKIQVGGISEDSFDSDGNLIFTDTYDSTYFDWLPHSDIYNSEWSNGYLWSNNNNRLSDKKVVTKSSEGTLTITLNKDDLPTDNNGNYYDYYVIPYYLTVKSEEALNALKSAAAQEEGGRYTISNTVTNSDFGTVTDTIDYETNLLSKEASVAELNKATGNYEVHYTLTLNPNAEKIGDGNSLEVIDTSENLSVDIDSIIASPSLGVSWNRDSSGKLKFIIPNGKKIIISYTAKVVGTGTVNYKNTAELHGQKKESSGSQNVNSSASGSSVLYDINIYKYESGDLMTSLEGVKFNLYVLDDGYKDDEMNRNSKPDENDSRWSIVNDADKPFITDEDGYSAINADSLTEHDTRTSGLHYGLYRRQWYMLKETETPTINGVQYEPLNKPYLFWIDDHANADYENGIYTNDDVIMISNTPKDTTKLGFTVKKTWEGADVNNLPNQITVHLYQKKDIYTDNSQATEYGSPITLKKSDFEGKTVWTGEFTNLPKGYAYYIKEDVVDGYTTTYEDENTIGYTKNGTIELTNSPVGVKPKVILKKEWYDSDGNTKVIPDVDFIRVNILKDGIACATVTLNASNGWIAELSNLDFSNSAVRYTVEEPKVDGYEVKGVTYTDSNGNSTNYLSGSGTITIANKKNDEPKEGDTSLTVKKKWIDMNGKELSGDDIKQLVAQVQVVRYKTKQQGTVVHFIKNTNINDAKSYEEFYQDIVVASKSSVTISLKSSNWNQQDMFVLTAPPEYWSEPYNKGFWDYVNNFKKPKAIASYSGDVSSGTQTYTFSTDGISEIYLYCLESISNNFDTSKGVTIASGSEASTSEIELDQNYSGHAIRLNSSNNWNYTFSGLPTKGIENGVSYSYSYAVKEINCTGSFTFDNYSTGSYEVDNINIPISRTSDFVIVTNRKKEAYELPETGGIGTRWYTIGGLLLCMAGVWMILSRNKKK
ncbi:putative surface-anchored collagen-binding protein [Lachnospiraceae bacterium TWA4]|nr:putative surface-anchored collagen-binding protein [Lachnospiraceae bacterium TWA4]